MTFFLQYIDHLIHVLLADLRCLRLDHNADQRLCSALTEEKSSVISKCLINSLSRLNMMDIIEERGMEIDLHRLPEMLGGIPVVPVSARKRTGLDVLMHAVVHHYEEGPQGVIVRYDREIEDRIQRVEDLLREKYPDLTNLRWHAIKMLEYDKEVLKDHPVELKQIVPRSFEKEIINEKYDYVESVIKECLFNKEEKSHMTHLKSLADSS